MDIKGRQFTAEAEIWNGEVTEAIEALLEGQQWYAANDNVLVYKEAHTAMAKPGHLLVKIDGSIVVLSPEAARLMTDWRSDG